MSKLIPQRGDYRDLICYRKAEVIYDITYHFCHKYLQVGDRTIDQMIQAARSGKQNIAEGSIASATSLESEIKLTNVAKASLLELLIDYEDYLRVRKLRQWEQNSIELNSMRKLGQQHNETEFFMDLVENRNDEVVANMAIVLIKQTDYLLHKLLEKQEQRFLAEGGFKEKMFAARIESRNKNKNNH